MKFISVKIVSVKIVVEDGDGKRCSPSCPHYDQFGQHGTGMMETCRVYWRRVPERERCDECREAKEL